ncbi:MAG: hypothetical protein HDR16_02010 [Lachnospiraceae bacterium]|nr:hypothetical protein [Lachnospiraceae bacterium]
MQDKIEECLEKAAAQIVPDEAAKKRILEGVKAKKVSRKRLSVRIPAAVLAACMLAGLLWFGGQSLLGEEVVVYAATEDNGWQKLEEGERILLKKEPYMVFEEGEGIEPFDEYGQCIYHPYKCIFRVEVPDNYRYSQQGVFIRDDHIWAGEGSKDVIEWRVAPERPEDAGRVMQGSLRIWIVNDKLEQVGAYDLKLTKEDGKCYAELTHVWGK